MKCRVCSSMDLQLAIDLGLQPWCNHFLKKQEVGQEPFYPLRVLYCNACSTVQLDYTVPKETMFGNHTYLSGVTRSLGEHFKKVALLVQEKFCQGRVAPSVLDIGSNDGTQLKFFQELGFQVLGVESSTATAQIANKNGIPTENTFFNEKFADGLGYQFDFINASGVFFHLEELHSVSRGIKKLLKDDGVFVVQFLYMKSIVENCAFDQIYHEHLLYYTLKTIGVLLDLHGLEMFDAYLSHIHGGSMIGFVGHKGLRPKSDHLVDLVRQEDASKVNEVQSYLNFAERIKAMKKENLSFVQKARAAGKRIYGMGAPVKGNTLLNYFGLKNDSIQYLVEKNPLRQGLYAPGSHIPVILEQEIAEMGIGEPDIYYVLAWNFKKEILENSKALIEQGVEFYFPVDIPL